MSAIVIDRSSQYYRRRNARRLGFLALACLGLTIFLGLMVAKAALVAITVAAIVLMVAIICRWPVVGYFISIFVVLPCEIFANPDGISTYTILPLTNLNFYTPLPVSATPLEMVIALTLLATVIRAWFKGERFLDRGLTSVSTAIFMAFLAYGYFYGIYIKHGEAKTAQWEIRALVYLPVLYFLTLYCMKDQKLWKVLNWMLPVGISLMGAISIERLFVLQDSPGNTFYAESINGFNHETALLFVILLMWCSSKFVYGGSRVEKIVAGLLIIPAVFCIFTSGRRVAFAALAGCLIIFLATLAIRHRKAFIISVIVLILIVPPYVVAFSKTAGPLGAAARAFSSTSAEPGSRDYNSDLYRLVEKNNVQMTIKTAPYTGIGFGQPFIRFISFIDLQGFTLQDYTPHIQVLWLWLKVGMFGWALFWFILCTALFKLGQLVKYGKFGNQLTLALVCGFIITTIMIYSYYDLGLINTRLMTLMGVAVGLIELAYRNIQRPVEAKTEDRTARIHSDQRLVASK